MHDQDNLERYYQAIRNHNSEKELFLLINDYVDYVIHDEKLVAILSEHILYARNELTQKLNDVETKVINECSHFINKFIESLKENPIFIEADKKLKQLINGSYRTSNPMGKEALHIIESMIWGLKDAGFDKEINKYYSSDGLNNYIDRKKISNTFNEYNDLHNQFEHGLKYAIWGCWNDLVLFCDTWANGEKKAIEAFDNHDLWGAMNISALKKEIDLIIEGKERKEYSYFKADDMKTKLIRFHLCLSWNIDYDAGLPSESGIILKGNQLTEPSVDVFSPILSKSDMLQCGKVMLSIERAIISIDNGATMIPIQNTESQEIKLLRILMENASTVVTFEMMDEEIFHSGYDGGVLSRHIAGIKQKLKCVLNVFGMTDDEFRLFLRSVRTKGYIISA